MKFIVDAQLPRRLAHALAEAGHDTKHTLDLPLGNRTADGDITSVAVREGRVVVTKDNDFVTAFMLKGVPPKLLLIATGNISNDPACQTGGGKPGDFGNGACQIRLRRIERFSHHHSCVRRHQLIRQQPPKFLFESR